MMIVFVGGTEVTDRRRIHLYQFHLIREFISGFHLVVKYKNIFRGSHLFVAILLIFYMEIAVL